MTDDLLRMLADLASEPAPGPDPRFADALEERLRAAPGPRLTHPDAPRAGWRHGVHIRRSLMVTGMAAVVATATGAVVAAPLFVSVNAKSTVEPMAAVPKSFDC